MVGIYKITNNLNQKIYIGKSKDIYKRWANHKSDSFCSEEKWKLNKRCEQTPIHQALRKYGLDNFTFEVIEECNEEELNEKERYWINYYDSYNKGYNATFGGDGYSCGGGEKAPGAIITQEECDIIKEKLKLRWTASQIQEIIPKATEGIISSINNGKTWYDPNEKYPISINNGHRLWSDEEALLIKERYAYGESITNLSKEYNVGLDTISNLINGKSYSNLPVIERQVPWKRISSKRRFTDEEVIKYRELAKTRKILNIFNEYKPDCGYNAFRNMIKGITYKNVGL